MYIKVGDIVHTFINEINPSKNKFVVCIQKTENWVLLINTEDRECYECVEISCNTYPFLKGKNRYVSCNKIFQIDLEKLQDAKVYASITNNDLQIIYNKIRTSKRLSPMQKKKILENQE